MTHSFELVGNELGVQIIDDRDIVVSSAAPNFSVTYRRDGLAPLLIAINDIGGSSEPAFIKFCAQAWKVVYQKARAVGWLSS